MNPDGYRVMGYAIPLALFKTADSGMKVYRDADATIEETYNTEEASRPFYQVSINNVRRGVEKKMTRYLKNIGVQPTLYYIYVSNDYNINYYFLDSQGNKVDHLYGLCNPGMIKPLELVITSEYDDYVSDFELHVLTRDLSS